ncbi:hypothetical protein N2152v2_004941 [Parachlorella kessleri]
MAPTGSVLRKSQELLARFDTLRFLATAGRAQRPRPAAAPPRPPASSPLQPTQQQETSPSAPREEWTEVAHKETGLTYYWNQRTGETTALGEPRPGPGGRVQQPRIVQQRTSLAGLVAAGAGIGLVFALLGRVL